MLVGYYTTTKCCKAVLFVTSNLAANRLVINTTGLVAWHSGNVFHPINKMTLHWIRIVLEWVTACERINHLGM